MNSRNKWQAGLAAGVIMATMTTLVIWLMGDNKTFEQSVVIGLIGSLIATPIFIWVLDKMAKDVMQAAAKALEEAPAGDENAVLLKSNATHFVKLEGVGGILVLTPKQLVFQSHGLNINKHRWEVALADISAFKRRKTLGIIPNGIEIMPKGADKPERFVVMDAGNWHEQLSIYAPHAHIA